MDINSFVIGYAKGKANGGGAPVEKDVNFYDYDGTLLHSFTLAEAQAMTELPQLPTQPGLICQEWNWTLEDIKAENNKVNVGATYITDDGKTRLYISILVDGRMDIPLHFTQTVSNGVTIDWGDGSAPQTVSGEGKVIATHTYANIGDYVISMEAIEGSTYGLGHGEYDRISVFGSNYGGVQPIYNNMLKKVDIGNNIPTLVNGALLNCYSLESVVIPKEVTSIGTFVLYSCYSLKSVVIPSAVTILDNNTFDYCYSLESVVMPKSVTKIGDNAFQYCYSLKSVVIPSAVTSVGSGAFQHCYSLKNIVMTKNVTSLGSYAFNSCYSIESIVFPKGITTISSYTCQVMRCLKSVIIPEGVKTIAQNAFEACIQLTSIVIPQSVTKIEMYAFRYNIGLAFIDFTSHTSVPTLSASTAFGNMADDFEIRVPAALYNKWIAATNWSSLASKIVAV